MNDSKFPIRRTGLLILLIVGPFAVSTFSQKPLRDTTEVYHIDDGTLVTGASSSLIRNGNGLTMTVSTNGLPAGAYTAWWVIENYPQYCTERPCSPDDEGNPLVQTSVFNATGRIVSGNGIGNFGAWVGIGGPYSGEVLFGPGLLNPLGADVYLVIRYHGPVIPGMVKQQTTTFDGGCSINTCSDEQIAFHISS